MKAAQARGVARAALRGNWLKCVGLLFLVGAIIFMLNAVVNILVTTITGSSVLYTLRQVQYAPGGYAFRHSGTVLAVLLWGFLGVLATNLVSCCLALGKTRFYINMVKKDQPADIAIVFSMFRYMGKAFLLYFLIALFVFLWSLLFLALAGGLLVVINVSLVGTRLFFTDGQILLIMLGSVASVFIVAIPATIISYRYAMAPYFMAQNPQIKAMQAIKLSRQVMKGQTKRMFCLGLSFIGWFILGGLAFGLGTLWVLVYMQAAQAAFYLELTGQINKDYILAVAGQG